MLEGLRGRTALVTGAARPRSIGRATARRLAQEGALVACVDLAGPHPEFPTHATATRIDLDDLVDELRANGGTAIGVRADVTDEAAVRSAVAQVTDELGPISLVANVAGGAGAGFGAAPLLAVPAEEFRGVVDLNLTGTFLVARACAERMVEHGEGGRIVNVSSQAGRSGWPLLGAYSAAKAGVVLLTQVMAKEWGPSGITVNAICPGTVDTDLLNPGRFFEEMMDATEPGGLQGWVDREIPLGRLQQPEEVAAAIAFLMSDDAAYITGEALNVSGGQTMV